MLQGSIMVDVRGSTTSILVNIPGEAASVVTCIDGYQMLFRAGQARPLNSGFWLLYCRNFGILLLTLSERTLPICLRFGPPNTSL